MGPSVVVLLFRDLPKFCLGPVSRSILNPFDCNEALWATEGEQQLREEKKENAEPYQIIVADAADAVSVNFSGRCKFLQI